MPTQQSSIYHCRYCAFCFLWTIVSKLRLSRPVQKLYTMRRSTRLSKKSSLPSASLQAQPQGALANFADGISRILDLQQQQDGLFLDVPVPLPNSYVCRSCTYTTTEHRQLKHHWSNHKTCIQKQVDLRFVCQHCGEGFCAFREAKAHLANHDSSETVYHRKLRSTVENFKSKPADFAALRQDVWLHDRLVDLALAISCLSAGPNCKVYPISTLFMATLEEFSKGVDFATRQFVLPWTFEAKALLFPINHLNTHWSLLYLDLEQKVAHHYDSLPSKSNTGRARTTFERLSDFADKKFGDVRFKDWNFQCESCSKQTDGVNCGPHSILNAKSLIQSGHVKHVTRDDCVAWRDDFTIIVQSLPQDITRVDPLAGAARIHSYDPGSDMESSLDTSVQILLAVPPTAAATAAGHTTSSQPDPKPPPEPPPDHFTGQNWLEFAKSLQLGRIMERIPKGARSQVAELLAELLIDVVENESTTACKAICISFIVLIPPASRYEVA